jgi:hypothetical protein
MAISLKGPIGWVFIKGGCNKKNFELFLIELNEEIQKN